jgi:plastocyanin
VSAGARAAFAVLLLLAAAHSAYGGGTVAGRVLLPEAPPPQRMPERYRAISPNVAMEAPDAPAAIVYLQRAGAGGDAGAAIAPTGVKASVAQKGLQFRPGVSAVRTGETVEFPNFDETYHSVFSYSKTKRFDLGRYRKGEEPASIVFDKPGVVKLFCEIHDHMRGAILVLDTPYFTKTGDDGAFRIDGVPPGRYRLTAWLDEDRVRTTDVEVVEGATQTVNVDAR